MEQVKTISSLLLEKNPKGYNMRLNSSDWKLLASIVNQGIDSHLEAFVDSEFDHGNGEVWIAPNEIKLLVRRLYENGGDECRDFLCAMMEASYINSEKYLV